MCVAPLWMLVVPRRKYRGESVGMEARKVVQVEIG